jgi:ribose transport system substrate-binding protein
MKSRMTVLCILLGLIGVTVSACGGGSGGTTSAGSGASSDSTLTYTQEELFKGTNKSPPTSGPTAQPGKTLWILSCGQSFSSCADATGAAEQAAHTVGWKTTVFDTKGDLPSASDGIRQAIAAHADGIYFWYIDCQNMKQPLAQAKAAGISVVASESFDCDYNNPNQKPLFTYTVHYVGGDWYHFVQDWSRATADYAIAKGNDQANVMYFIDDTALVNPVSVSAFKDEVSKCSGCTSVIEQFPISELGTGALQSRTQQDLLKNPDVNSVAAAYDAIIFGGVAAGVRASNRDLILQCATGESSMDLVRNGTCSGGIGYSLGWEAYSGIDALNRLFHGQRPVNSGMGLQAYDKEHNLPATGSSYQAPIDFQKIYEKTWGVK